ncbi:MAG: type IX secretion system sortase PorU, partial [Dysgonamonadaceae bacterium]|nr:type IX secretion system sortase PorU [Dysgonamonadaceae bacterium]
MNHLCLTNIRVNKKSLAPLRLCVQLFVLLILCLSPLHHLFAESNYAETSILSSGNWYQMKTDGNGIYKLTYDEMKKYLNDPSKVKIYGYGGWILDENFTKPSYIDDLPEVSVYINKGSDNVFNSGDYLLFYGRGTVKWTYNPANDAFEHENNPYSTFGSYFLTEGESGPKEMTTILSVSNPDTTVSVFDDYALHERDLTTIANTGRELFGESFAGQSTRQQFSFSIPGITSDQGKIQLSFAAAPKATATVTLSAGKVPVVSLPILTMASDSPYTKARVVEKWENWDGEKTDPVTITVDYNAGGAFANLNYIVLNMKRTLQFYNTSFTFFRNRESQTQNVRYAIDKTKASIQVWDITGNFDAQLMQTTLDGTRLHFTAQANADTLREYVMVDPSGAFPSPKIVGEKIPSQNLHALPQTDMVILTPSVYLAQAEVLAAKHREKSGLKVEVVEERQVFNEFSSGTPDASAYRRLMKMFYDRAADEQEKPKYLLLFGDGMFDNRFLEPKVKNLDPKYYLLTYQMRESVDELKSYGSDDYFGLLEDGNPAAASLSGTLCLGIGRFPVNSVDQAENAVNKVIAYMNDTKSGNWKSNLVFTADDTGADDPAWQHTRQSNTLADYMYEKYPEYVVHKYFMDAYRPVSVNGKTTYPDAKKAFLKSLNNGCFLVNYTGHGNTSAWSAEDMLNITDVRQMDFENLPLWITATCDFGWFDGISASGGEAAFLNKKSGAIALYTTSRVVNSGGNFDINQKLIHYLFLTDPAGKHLRLGDVLRESKNALQGDNKFNYILLGDPALELNYPKMKVKVETVNGEVVDDDNTKFAFKALEKITVTGSIVDDDGNKANGFSGELRASIFDGKQETKSYRSLNNEYFSFASYPNMISQTKTNVANGSFSFSFTVPLDISYAVDDSASYANKNGKMNFYATLDGGKSDAFGNFSNYILSGTSEVDPDWTGPQIKEMYLNTNDFKDGGNVNETPYFYARVYDETGINVSGTGFGHDFLISIDGKADRTYYQSQHDFELTSDGDNWLIGFSIPHLPAGKHVLSFHVWDIMNNPTVDTLHFNVIKGYQPTIVDLYAKGNPAKTSTIFVLSHNLPETLLNVDIRVYDLAERIVWNRSQQAASTFGS